MTIQITAKWSLEDSNNSIEVTRDGEHLIFIDQNVDWSRITKKLGVIYVDEYATPIDIENIIKEKVNKIGLEHLIPHIRAENINVKKEHQALKGNI